MNDYDFMMGLIDPEVMFIGFVLMLGIGIVISALSKKDK